MYIQPNTNIFILKSVPLDNRYNHTIYFEDKTKQYQYFYSKVKHTLVENSYQRVNRGICRVEIKAELLYDCNYMMFQNASFGTKWFYAFINKVEYVNNAVSEIHFEIDVMQTWLNGEDYTLKPCFVEREHSETDEIGENIVPESLELGEYMYTNYSDRFLGDGFDNPLVAIAICDVKRDGSNGNFSRGYVYEKTYSGSELWFYKLDNITDINSKLSEYAEKPNAIVSMYIVPQALIPDEELENGGVTPNYNHTPLTTTVSCDKASVSDWFGDYKPKNHKLYTYPYNYCHIDNGSGMSLVARYEFFKDNKPSFSIEGCIQQPVKLTLRPLDYKGLSSNSGHETLNTECLTLEGYPLCSWNNDSYSTWLAQNSLPMMINGAIGLAGIGASNVATSLATSAYMAKHGNNQTTTVKIDKMVGTNDINNGMSALQGIGGALCSAYQASIASDVCRGSANNGNVNWAHGKHTFFQARAHITPHYAKCIDEYFSMYGYQTNRVKVPNISSREYWNYVKTMGCNIVGDMPTDDIKLICSIYDKGITFWKKGEYVGNYGLDNSLDYDETPDLQ